MLVLAADPVDDAPILDLRLRKGVRRHGLALAQAMPAETSLEAAAKLSLRFAPGPGGAVRRGPGGGARPRSPSEAELERLAALAGSDADRAARAGGAAARPAPAEALPRSPARS